jgi:hypothetical protein
MVVFPIGSLTDFVTELTMSIIGNSSLQHAERAKLFWLPSSIEPSLSVTWIAKRQDNLQK